MEEIVEDLIPIGDYDSLIKRIKWSERLNIFLFITVLFISFMAFIAIGAHTFRYEKRLHQAVNGFKNDVMALTVAQNAAISDLNRVVLDKTWINFQRISLEQLQDFSSLLDYGKKPEPVMVISTGDVEGVGGK